MNHLHLYNSLTHKVEPFIPLSNKNVGMYTCGPTVYDYQHIGNYRTFIFEDILKRVLRVDGYRVEDVMNITDVGHLVSDGDEGEDKLEKGARREGKTAWEVAEFYTEAFKSDLAALNILRPTKLVRATDHIAEQIDLIQRLEKKQFVYKLEDGLYMNTKRVKEYGKLVGLKAEGLQAGARVKVTKGKRNPTDFALWKFSPEGTKRDMEWSSPWGVGFPGWHLECSAMAMKYLGESFDIHCGGIDHAPIHHTNEIAQTETATGKKMARYWMHVEFLLMGENKMSKSAGTFITIKNLVEHEIHPLAFKYFTYGAHYRNKQKFSWTALQAAQSAYDRLLELAADWSEPKVGCADFENYFMQAVNNDLNMPEAIAFIWKMVKSDLPGSAKLKSLLKFDEILGLRIQERAAEIRKQRQNIPTEISAAVKERDTARLEKRFADADVMRDKIQQAGWMMMDTPEGTRLKKI